MTPSTKGEGPAKKATLPATTEEPGAPEGGWGWVMVFSSHVTHLLTWGTLYALSVMYVDWLDDFQAGRGQTSWIISTAVATMNGIGPVPALLASLIGYKWVVVAGGIMAASGYLLASFATNVYGLILSVGIITGCGGGFCYIPAIATLAPWFKKRRSLAIGLGTAGVGIGSFVCAPTIHWLIQQYGWRGALMIIAGIQLHLSALGLLLRNPPKVVVSQSAWFREDTADKLTLLEIDECQTEAKELTQSMAPNQYECSVYHSDNLTERPLSTHLYVARLDEGQRKTGGSLQHLKYQCDGMQRSLFRSVGELRQRDYQSKRIADTNDKETTVKLYSLAYGSLHSLPLAGKGCLQYDAPKHAPLHDNIPKAEESCLLKEEHETLSQLSPTLPQKKIDGFTSGAASELTPASRTPPSPSSFLHRWKFVIHPFFIAYIISNILTNLAYISPVLFLVDRAIENGIGHGFLLISINGAGNVFGRVALPVLGDWLVRDRLVAYILCLGVCGLAIILSSAFGDSLILYALFAFLFGSMMGCYTTLVAVVTVDLVGVDLVGHAYGILLTFTGMAGWLGPPLAGWLYDLTGDYTTSYLLNGCFVIASSLVLLPVVIKKNQMQKRAKPGQSTMPLIT